MGSAVPCLYRSSTAIPGRPRLPVIFKEIAKSIEDELLELDDLQEVPEYIQSNRVWRHLQAHIRSVRLLCICPYIAVLLLLLDDNTQLVIKGCSKEHTREASQQLGAEVKIAALFPCHPLMATAIGASCEEEDGVDGSVCLVLPYAGVSFAAIMEHPDWKGKLTQQERTDVFAELAAHTMTVHAILQGDGGSDSYMYRDTKPHNVTYDPTSEQIKLIDYGLAMRTSGFDYHGGFTPGRFTPEMVDPADDFKAYYTPHGRCFALNCTTDVFLTGQQGVEMICGLPSRLHPPASPFDVFDRQVMDPVLLAHHQAGYPRLISKLTSRKARAFLLKAMAANSCKRLTPAAALRHRFLAGRAAAVEARVVETSAAHTEQVCHILKMLAPLQGQPGVFLAVQHHRQHLQEQQSTTWPAPAAVSRVQSSSNSSSKSYHTCSYNQGGSMDVASSEASGSSRPQAAAQLVDGPITTTSCSITSNMAAAKLVDGCMTSTSCSATSSAATTMPVDGPITATNSTTSTTAAAVLVEGPMTTAGSSTAADAAAVPDAPGKQKLAGRLLSKLKLLKSMSGNSRSSKLFGGSKAAKPAGADELPALQLTGADVVVVVESGAGVAVPGFCGMRWWGGISNKKAGSKVVV